MHATPYYAGRVNRRRCQLLHGSYQDSTVLRVSPPSTSFTTLDWIRFMLRPAPCLNPKGPLSPGFSYRCRSGFRVNWQLPWQIPFNLLEFLTTMLLHSASWRSRSF